MAQVAIKQSGTATCLPTAARNPLQAWAHSQEWNQHGRKQSQEMESVRWKLDDAPSESPEPDTPERFHSMSLDLALKPVCLVSAYCSRKGVINLPTLYHLFLKMFSGYTSLPQQSPSPIPIVSFWR